MKTLLVLVLFFYNFSAYSQGEDCDLSLYLPNVNDYCSAQAQYTNVGATPGAFSLPTCWGAAQTEDVWFSFIATGTDLMLSVSGNGSDGTITNPKVALYSGSCATMLSELGCTNTSTNDVAQLYKAGLTPGQTYYIRVSTTNANEGTFKLCVNSYTQPLNPGADCSGAAYLCDKSTVSNASFSGGGANMFEPEFTSCMSMENNSVWYYWQCSVSGTLTIDITPTNPSNDIDYIFYQLNTSNPCGSRTVARCNTSACLNAQGSTGLSATDFDISEDPGCDPGENAYCSQVNMVAGQYYAILIDNSTSNAGFSMSFGGTGQFTGPDPNFTTTNLVICEGQTVTFDGSTSTNVGGGLNWVFSTGSSPTSATGAGPHVVTYATAGNYVAILNGSDATGCQDAEVANITVNVCGCSITATNSGNVCEGTASFNLSATAVSGATYSWTGPNGFTSTSQNPTGVTVPSTAGTYNFVVTADDGTQTCTSTTTLTVYATPTINAPLTTLCVGNTTNLTGSGTAGVSPWTSSNTSTATVSTSGTVTAVATGTTTITYTDNHTCTNTQDITVVANPTASISGSTTVCNGGNADITFTGTPNATITYQINGGANQTVVLDATGSAIVNSGGLSVSATYSLVSVQVNPPTGCLASLNGTATITVGNPPTVNQIAPITACLNSSVVVPTFVSSPSGATFDWTNDNVAIGLAASGSGDILSFNATNTGSANISVIPTLNGCVGPAMIFTITVQAPPVSNAGVDVSFCAGHGSGTLGVNATPGYLYSWSPSNGLSSTTIANPTVSNLSAGIYTYTVTTTDALGCTSTDEVTVDVLIQPTAMFTVNPISMTLENTTVTVSNTSIDALNYSWNFGDGFVSNVVNPSHTYPESPGVYPITLTVQNGVCVDSIVLHVTIVEELILYVPNAFTPDGDEFNNTFTPILNEAYDYQNYRFDVYNRWGELIFESHNPLVGWDGSYHGKLCKEGAYVWKIEVKKKNQDDHFIYHGHVNLLH